jgi:hypothetical protein
MSRDEFRILIESIGFKNYTGGNFYDYKEHHIALHNDSYYYWNGYEYKEYSYNDLIPIKKDLKKELRSYKLRRILE